MKLHCNYNPRLSVTRNPHIQARSCPAKRVASARPHVRARICCAQGWQTERSRVRDCGRIGSSRCTWCRPLYRSRSSVHHITEILTIDKPYLVCCARLDVRSSDTRVLVKVLNRVKEGAGLGSAQPILIVRRPCVHSAGPYGLLVLPGEWTAGHARRQTQAPVTAQRKESGCERASPCSRLPAPQYGQWACAARSFVGVRSAHAASAQPSGSDRRSRPRVVHSHRRNREHCCTGLGYPYGVISPCM